MIEELRILPPLAIARFGAAPTPMDNYDTVIDPELPLGYRALRPAETLQVDSASGEITGTSVPDRLRFTEDGEVRPVAPFLEVWALTGDGQLEPLTIKLLEDEGATPSDVRWRVQVANLKAARRTGEERDRIEADTDGFADHAQHTLDGTCRNFWPGKSIPFGSVRYIKPTAEHPQIRLRFTPGPGHVYGASQEPPEGPLTDPNVVDIVYDGTTGPWLGHIDRGPAITVPGLIYYGGNDDPPASRGYLDDGCDGLVRVSLEVGGTTLSAYGRIGAGPPAYAPDALPIRSVADELEQALFGPAVELSEATLERVEEIVRCAFENVRLMNTAAMNRGGMAAHDARPRRFGGPERRPEPIMARSLVDDVALENLHQSLLVALRSGTAPWFADALRKPEELGDLTDQGRRKMPAMMRGADGRHLTLTRRQIDLIRKLVGGPVFSESEGGSP